MDIENAEIKIIVMKNKFDNRELNLHNLNHSMEAIITTAP